MIEHVASDTLRHDRTVHILVIGAGGNGSAIFLGLPYLNQAMRVWGYRHDLEVTLMDADIVSETNCVRQPFSMADVGLNKATVLVNRVNLFWGLEWKACNQTFTQKTAMLHESSTEFVIGCVDTRAARNEIHTAVSGPRYTVSYWLDLGNNAASGQYVLGQPQNHRNRRSRTRLRTVSELYPEIVDVSAGEDALPSCSAAEALQRQEPYINQVLASSALSMLARLLWHRRITHHGAFFNAASGQMSALPADPDHWAKIRRRPRRPRFPS